MKIAGLIFMISAILYGLHTLASWAEARGWIYYRKLHGRSGALGNAFLEVQALLEPDKRYVVEERKKDLAEEDESGEPPG